MDIIKLNEKGVCLTLARDGEDTISIRACNEKGTPRLCGYIVGLKSDGKLKRYQNINPDLGLLLEGCSRKIIRSLS